MKLRTNIFLWVFPAIGVSMAALVLVTMTYSERLYREDINREIFGSLAGVAASLDRRLLIERDIVRGLSTVPAVRDFISVIETGDETGVHPEYSARHNRVNRFLEIFQSVRLSLNAVRILDLQGNTLVKVQSGERVPAILSSLGDLPIIEDNESDEQFLQALQAVAPGGVAAIVLPVDDDLPESSSTVPVMNSIVPLDYGGRVVGYFAVDPPLGPLDRTLDVAQRVYGGELFVAEVNAADPERDGLILYDDRLGISLSAPHENFQTLHDVYPEIADRVFNQPVGFVDSKDGLTRIYYQELLPYPDRLVGWVIGVRVDMSRIQAPFLTRRTVILTAVALALLLSLLLAHAGAAHIATPVKRLADSLVAYARGEKVGKFVAQGPREVYQAGEAFNSMTESLEEAERKRDEAERAMLQNAKLASLGQMAAGIGHEINNPLSNILSLTKLVERTLPESDDILKKDVNAIKEEVQRVSRIVKAILDFGRQAPPHFTTFEVASWLKDSLEVVRSEAGARNVNLVSKVMGNAELEGDRDLLQQALVNLLCNAIQASPPGGTVTVRIQTTGNRFVVKVEDEGAGISPEIIDKVFDPFFTTKSEGQGSGLGLSISLAIIERHGGTLELTNCADGGAVATVRLSSLKPVQMSGDKST